MLRGLCRTATVARTFSSRAALSNAQVFRMPAMSPTMTEGGIVSWKYKSGESFSSGDVLLEVETDKATIDVEAVDDGVMWEVLMQDGETNIPVGKPIALLAEPGDDLASLEKPSLDDASAQPAAKEPEQPSRAEDSASAEPQTPSESKPASASNASSELVGKANAALKITPAVEILLHRNGISNEDAFAKIPASGPKGRLLKGDVLAYLGQIEASAVTRVAEYIKNKEHLDLSNIKIAPPQAPAPAEKEAASAVEKPKPSNIVKMDFKWALQDITWEDDFKASAQRVIEASKREAYAERFPQYNSSPVANNYTSEDLFDSLLAAPVTKDRFKIKNVTYNFLGRSPEQAPVADAFDDLLGLPPKPVYDGNADYDFTAVDVGIEVEYDAKLPDAKEFVDQFKGFMNRNIYRSQMEAEQRQQ
ncbi:hypothetical protein OXX59_008347 [Metschnikowia pulcherrima]